MEAVRKNADLKKMALTTLKTLSNLSEMNLEITSPLELWVGHSRVPLWPLKLVLYRSFAFHLHTNSKITFFQY